MTDRAGDLLMVSVLLRLRASGLPADHANLAAYVTRGEAPPAYARAFAAQLAVSAPAGGVLTIGADRLQGGTPRGAVHGERP